MSLTAGTRLGPYEILAPLGAGGMGEVYRARDTKLSRSVAIKILPDAFAADPERLARFERDSEVIAHAAARQSAYVATHRSGPHSAEAERLLSELAAAERCLRDPNEKYAYDIQAATVQAQMRDALGADNPVLQKTLRGLCALRPSPASSVTTSPTLSMT